MATPFPIRNRRSAMKELKNQPHRVIVGKVRGAVGSCLFISAVVLGLLSTNYAQVQTCTPPPPNMVSWWPGDGNANDIQGGNNGTLQGGATFASGKVGQAFSFDGVNDYGRVDLKSVVYGDFMAIGSRSVSDWVNRYV